eukprot:1252609-Alexandrium_andersonii.AAC.1
MLARGASRTQLASLRTADASAAAKPRRTNGAVSGTAGPTSGSLDGGPWRSRSSEELRCCRASSEGPGAGELAGGSRRHADHGPDQLAMLV